MLSKRIDRQRTPRAMTFAEWRRIHGYNPGDRTYDESLKPSAAAIPGAHANTHRPGPRKVC